RSGPAGRGGELFRQSEGDAQATGDGADRARSGRRRPRTEATRLRADRGRSLGASGRDAVVPMARRALCVLHPDGRRVLCSGSSAGLAACVHRAGTGAGDVLRAADAFHPPLRRSATACGRGRVRRAGARGLVRRTCAAAVPPKHASRRSASCLCVARTAHDGGEPMKLMIQIPCYNEAETLAVALAALPRSVPGFDAVEWLVIDDGSTDQTVKVALQNGVDHVVRHTRNCGLARAFMTGLQACTRLGADVIVNTDADNQYCAEDIPALTTPILTGQADIVVGARPIESIEHFSPVKKLLQKLGSWVVRVASRTSIPDAPSGFRAISREAAQHLVVFNEYTYTLETIIQAGQKNMAIRSVPVRVNADLRPSRLVKSIPSYIKKSVATIVRIFVIYRPFKFFGTLGAIVFTAGVLIGARFLYFYLSGDGSGHVQSLILASVLLGMGFQTLLVAFVADLLAANRKLLEDVRYKVNRVNDQSGPPVAEATEHAHVEARVLHG